MPTVVITPFILLLPLALLAWYSRRWALLVILTSLSAYVIRGNIFGLPTTWLELAIYLTAICWLIKGDWRHLLKLKQSLTLSWLIPICFWLTAGVGGVLVASDTILALGVWKGFIIDPLILSLLVAGEALGDKPEVWWRRCLAALLIGAVATTLLAIAQGWLTGATRLQSGYDSPNVLAMYLSPILVGVVVWLANKNNRLSLPKGQKWGWFMGSLILILGVVLTNSYAAVVSILGALAVAAWWGWRPKLGLVVGTLLVMASLLLPFMAVVSEQQFFTGHTNVIYGVTSGEVRLTLWRQAIGFIAAKPILGLGLGQWQPAFLTVAREQGWLSIKNTGLAIELHYSSLYPHNLWLTTWLATGLLGLGALIWLVLKVFSVLSRQGRQGRQVAALVPAAALVVQILYGSLDTPLWRNDLAVLWWLAIVAVWAIEIRSSPALKEL